VWRGIICGIGFGFFQAPNNRELMGSAPREQSGSASGVLATARVTGQSLGAALVAIVLGAGLGAAAVTTAHAGSEFEGPLRNALWIAAACAGLAALVSALRLRTPRILSAAGATMPENRSSKWTGRL
jgi:DHA2 family multidrug resistance protein-like MFS transporter